MRCPSAVWQSVLLSSAVFSDAGLRSGLAVSGRHTGEHKKIHGMVGHHLFSGRIYSAAFSSGVSGRRLGREKWPDCPAVE